MDEIDDYFFFLLFIRKNTYVCQFTLMIDHFG